MDRKAHANSISYTRKVSLIAFRCQQLVTSFQPPMCRCEREKQVLTTTTLWKSGPLRPAAVSIHYNPFAITAHGGGGGGLGRDSHVAAYSR